MDKSEIFWWAALILAAAVLALLGVWALVDIFIFGGDGKIG